MEAIAHAEDGLTVSTRTLVSVAVAAARRATFPATADYFLPDGAPIAACATLVNPDYADTLRQIAARGAAASDTGEIAKDFVAATRASDNTSLLSLAYLTGDEVTERPAVCYDHRGAHVCGMDPPSSGLKSIGLVT